MWRYPASQKATPADLESKGINLSDLDMMIAAHAVAEKLTLVSRDKAFLQLRSELGIEIW